MKGRYATMFKRIVVPLDGSKRAECALPVAVALARARLGSVLLVRVTTPEALDGISTEGTPVAPDVFEAERAEVTAYLDLLASQEMFKDVQTAVRAVEGIPAEAILEAAASMPADLIVMSSRGRSGFTRWLLGSVTQKVARHSMVPVLVVPDEGEEGAALSDHRAARVLVALDGSRLSEEALLPAAQLSAALSAPLIGSLHLLRVVQVPARFEDSQGDAFNRAQEQAIREAMTYLSRLEREIHSAALARYGLHVVASVEAGADVADTLLRVAERGGREGSPTCEVMALATHGRSGLSRWVMGSVAERVLGATRLPLLIVRARQSEEQVEIGL
jgi:nucleotide-binding universal stress UspA family protein